MKASLATPISPVFLPLVIILRKWLGGVQCEEKRQNDEQKK